MSRYHSQHMVLLLVIAIAGVAASPSTAGAVPGDASGCTLYVLRGGAGEVIVDAVAIAEGRTVVLSAAEIITFILPLSFGQSGDLIQQGQPKGDVVARCENGMLHVTVRFDDGRQRRLPPVDVSSFPEYDVRVNVVGGDGSKQAFMIRSYGDVEIAGGPVVNMFGGSIPLQEGDYAITTEVTQHRPPESVEGQATLSIVEGILLAEGALPDGSKSSFIIDFGASGTIVARSFLPEDTPIQKVKAIRYSDEEGHELDGILGGAGGSVSGFLGSAPLTDFTLGAVSFGDVTVGVIREMPGFIDREVVGIVGLDLLRRSPFVVMEFAGDEGARLAFSAERPDGHEGGSLAVPFKISIEHIFIDGVVRGAPVDFLLDTGARYSMLSQDLAERAGLELSERVARDFRGLDGSPIPARTTVVDSFTLGGHAIPGRHFYVAALSVLESFGLAGSGALLGVDFLQGCRVVTFDFIENIIYLNNR